MQHRGLLILMLVAATLAVDAAALALPFADGPTRHLLRAEAGGRAMFLPAALAFSQAGLVAVWTALGGRSVPWRLIALAAVVAVWGRCLAGLYSDEQDVVVYAASLLASALVAGWGLVALRYAAVRLADGTGVAAAEPRPDGLRPRQFSLGSVLAWTTAAAVWLGFGRFLVLRCLAHPVLEWALLPAIAFGVGGGFVTLAGLWFAVGERRFVARALALGAATWLATESSRVAGLWLPPGEVISNVPISVSLAQAALVVGSLLVFRVAGYRLVWASRNPLSRMD